MDCQPVFLPIADQGIALVCDGDPDADDGAWNLLLEPVGDEGFVTLEAVQNALANHRENHPAPVQRPVANRKPKFTSGLGMAPGTKITHVGGS